MDPRMETSRTVAEKIAIEPTTSSSTWSNEAARTPRRPSSVSSRLSKPPCRLNASRYRRASHVWRPAVPSTEAPKNTPVGASTAAMCSMAAALRVIGPGRQWKTRWSAAESNGGSTGSGLRTSASTVVTSRRRRRRAAWSSTFGFGSRSVTRLPARQAGLVEEVAGARPDVEMAVADVLPVAVHEPARRAAPDEPGGEAEDERVVQPQDRARVVALPAPGGIVAIHSAGWSPGGTSVADADDEVHRLVDGHALPSLECLGERGGIEQALKADAGIGLTDQLGEAHGRPHAVALAQAFEGAHDQRRLLGQAGLDRDERGGRQSRSWRRRRRASRTTPAAPRGPGGRRRSSSRA